MSSLPKVHRKIRPEKAANSAKSIVILLFLVCGLFLLIWKGMSWLAHDDLSPQELYQQTMDGRRDSRRMAAMEWHRKLLIENQKNPKAFDGMNLLSPKIEQQEQLCRVLQNSISGESNPMSGDEAFQSAVVGVLGFSYFREPAAKCLWTFIRMAPSSYLRAQSLLSLSRLALPLPSSEDDLFTNLPQDSDPYLRKIGAFSMGVLVQDPERRSRFEKILGEFLLDADESVRWNAAFSLARWNSMRGEKVFKEIFQIVENTGKDGRISPQSQGVDENPNGKNVTYLTEAQLLAIEQAFSLVAQISWEPFMKKLSVIADSHPQIKVRLAAKKALAEIR